ncbi:HmuY family protein [Sphingobacterium sp. LRF_L2]|uniref:HmuY family protein n=1 Tax=Sphingobacterium sp. LRF_L2 TaxID=3369421 RepID=UPI003F6145D6
MKYYNINFGKRLSLFFIGFILLGSISSCSKSNSDDDQPTEEVPEEEASNPELFNTLVRVNNLQASQESSSETDASPIYFSLETNKELTSEHRQTRNWDIAFSGMFTSFMAGNNGTNSGNLGYGNKATGGILVLEQAFDEVTNVPADSEFKTTGDVVGTDNYGDFGEGIGWYLYDFDGTIVRDGATENQHIAYALASSLTLQNGTVVKPRTIVVRTAKGNYAKIKMISCYKDLLTADLWKKDSEKMYFTFEYVLVPAGSTTFEIK